jgi:hypothetical protein
VDRRFPISIQKPPPDPRHERIIGRGEDFIPEGDSRDIGGPRTGSAMGRYLGMQIYRLMLDSADTLRLEISKLLNGKIPISLDKKELEIPEPDALFFYVLLDIVGQDAYARGPGHDIPERPPNSDFLEVGRDMMAAGFEIPLLFQKFFIRDPEVGDQI